MWCVKTVVLHSACFYVVFSLYKYLGYLKVAAFAKKAKKKVLVSEFLLISEPITNKELHTSTTQNVTEKLTQLES